MAVNLPNPSRKARDGLASTKPPREEGFVEAARSLGGQPFASSRTKLDYYLRSVSIGTKFSCFCSRRLVLFLRKPKMSGTRIPKGLFFAIVLAAIAQCIHDFPLLPDRLASHFAASGMPNGWMSKQQFFITYAVVLVPALLVEFWVSHRIANKPYAKLNLPNKEYWLAPERRAETFAYFDCFFAWYGCAFLLVEVFAMGLAMRANFDTPPQLPSGPIVSVLAGFVLFNIVAVMAVYRRFATTG
jgi:hypothetical protein